MKTEYKLSDVCGVCDETWANHYGSLCPWGKNTAFTLKKPGETAPAICEHCGKHPHEMHAQGCQASVARLRAAGAPVLSSAPQLLNKAAELMVQRGKQYDQPQGGRSMGRAVNALNTVLGREAITESEGWLLMQILKDVRDRQTTAPHADSLEDCVAYSALKAEARLKETQK